jgi:hypothetical protein
MKLTPVFKLLRKADDGGITGVQVLMYNESSIVLTTMVAQTGCARGRRSGASGIFLAFMEGLQTSLRIRHASETMVFSTMNKETISLALMSLSSVR